MPRRRGYRLGDHLVEDSQGTVRYASEVRKGRYGRQKGLDNVYVGDLDDAGVDDLDHPLRRRKEPKMRKPVTGEPRIIWEFYDENGDPV